ncbi:MAG: acyltransferase [candidate division KSB1 bacterium]|nr:acyltransferase [candidate division KSB1 bacterium]
MRVAFVQMSCLFGRRNENLEKAEALISAHDADLFVLPELFSSGYLFRSAEEVAASAEEIPSGPTSRFLAALSAKKQCFIVAGVAEAAQGKVFNSALLVGPHGVLAVYRKTHLFLDEALWFTPGDTGFVVADIGQARVGLMICFDWIFPEAARTLALKGADVLCHPANLVLPYCQNAMTTRALENGVFAVTANRIGSEERDGQSLCFTGRSQIVDPRGRVLVAAGESEETVGIAEIAPEMARDKMFTARNHLLKDRRPEMYELRG